MLERLGKKWTRKYIALGNFCFNNVISQISLPALIAAKNWQIWASLQQFHGSFKICQYADYGTLRDVVFAQTPSLSVY